MQIAVTHTHTDFDALASLVAATFLYPGAVGVLPSQLRPNVKNFLALHRDLFQVFSARELDLEKVTGLIVVDTNNWGRLEQPDLFRNRDGLSIDLWDHHLKGGDIEPGWKCQEQSGATITLMLREMKDRDCAFSPMHATLFLMGIYEDTGHLVYPSTRAEDVHAAGFLLENGADLNVATAYLSSSFDGGHTDILTKMLECSQAHHLGGYEVGVLLMKVENGLTMLSSVVAKYKEIKGLDAAIGIFTACSDRCMVIGCAGVPEIDIGGIMRKLGGGGHTGAGSAMVRSDDAESVRLRVMEFVSEQLNRPRTWIRDIMSRPEALAPPSLSLRDARTMIEASRSRTVLVVEDGRFCGSVSREECAKAKTEAQWKAPVKSFMRRNIPVMRPGDVPREALRLMVETGAGVLPVVEDGRLAGVVTRADLMLHIYEF